MTNENAPVSEALPHPVMGRRLWKLVEASSQPALRAIPLRGDLAHGPCRDRTSLLMASFARRGCCKGVSGALSCRSRHHRGHTPRRRDSEPARKRDRRSLLGAPGLHSARREVHDEFMRPSAFGNAAGLPQELLQVEDLVGIADIDVHAAGRSGVAATESPLSLSSQTPVCQEVLSPPSFRRRSDFGSGQSSSPWPTRRFPSKSLKVQPGDRGSWVPSEDER